jgi:hypothetical protein
VTCKNHHFSKRKYFGSVKEREGLPCWVPRRELCLRRQTGRFSHNDHSPHDGMNPALIRITTRGKVWNGIAASGVNGSGIKAAPVGLIKTSVMGDCVMRGSRIVPSNRGPARDGDSRRHIVWRPTVHEHPTLRRRGTGRPDSQQKDNRYQKHTAKHIIILRLN